MNWRAVQWAYEQEDLGVTAKAVLMTYAMHADAKGYSWPGVELIASTWGMDRRTVRRGIDVLISLDRLFRTKKTRGWTGQVKVYRLPKITYESGAKFPRFENDGSGDKAGTKRGQSGAKMYPEHKNNRTMNRCHVTHARPLTPEQQRQFHDLHEAVTGLTTDEEKIEKLKQLLPDRNVKWHRAEYLTFCRKRHKTPTMTGLCKRLAKAKPELQPATAKPNATYQAMLQASVENSDHELQEKARQ